jgi:2-oxoglutarate ferredoxin oxidoreductase subunit beta
MGPTDTRLPLTRKDFVSDQEVRWCPGCGDYAILAQAQRVLPNLGVPRENIVFISGIGCSSRFPYYLNTYGFHSIHGRAATFASGLKITRPELLVFVITGDGDGLSIGGNHLIHALRRNMDLNIILFNNRIYGLTKGQYSPTSEVGKRTVSSPNGSLEQPISPTRIALAAEASFVARAVATDTRHLSATLERAAHHRGGCFVEVYQNCNVYNDGAFDYFAERSVRAEQTVNLEHGKPLIFGKNRDQGIKLDGLTPVICDADDPDLLVHDEKIPSNVLPYLLAHMSPGAGVPLPLGVLRAVDKPTFEEGMADQIDAARERQGDGDVAALLRSGDTWTVG